MAQGVKGTHFTGTRSRGVRRRETVASALFLRHIDWFKLDGTMSCSGTSE